MKVTFKYLVISSNFIGDKASPWDYSNWNNHKVKVVNTLTKKSFSFDFWASIEKPEMRNREDHLSALSCIIGDALSGNTKFSEFCGEFGYDSDSIKAFDLWKKCKKTHKRAYRVITDLYGIQIALQEAGI